MLFRSGRVAVLKKEGELILAAGERAVVMKEGEPSLAPKTEELVTETRETGLLIKDKRENTSAAVSGHNEGRTEETKVSEPSRIPRTLPAPLTSETALRNTSADTSPAAVNGGISEKILDYEVDLDSMDEKTRRIFFPKRP